MADKSAKKRKLFRSNKQNVKHIIVNRKKKKQSEINEEIQSLSHQYSEVSVLFYIFVGDKVRYDKVVSREIRFTCNS